MSAQLGDRIGTSVKALYFNADLTDSSWSLFIKGETEIGQAEIEMSGFLWGQENGDWIISYSGAGKIGNEPIKINGLAAWPFEKIEQASDRYSLKFNQVAKFGEHSRWAWTVGTEIIVGGAIGAGSVAMPIILSTAATAGLTTPVNFVIGLGAAIRGAASMVSISTVVRKISESDKPTIPPLAPPAPTPEERILPKQDRIYVAISNEGNLVGAGPNNGQVLEGYAKSDKMSGGVISSK